MGDTEDTWGPEAVTVTHEPWHSDTAEEDKWQSSGQRTQCDTWLLALACQPPGSLPVPPDTNKSLLTLGDLALAVGGWPWKKEQINQYFWRNILANGLRYSKKNILDPQCLAHILYKNAQMWLIKLFLQMQQVLWFFSWLHLSRLELIKGDGFWPSDKSITEAQTMQCIAPNEVMCFIF